MQDYQLRQRDYLLQISRAITSRLDLPSLLELVLKSAVELLRGQVGLIVLRGRDDVLRVRASYGLPAGLVRFFQPLWADLPGMARTGCAPVELGVCPTCKCAWASWPPRPACRVSQVVALPLVIEEKLLGAIYIFRIGGGAFSAGDRCAACRLCRPGRHRRAQRRAVPTGQRRASIRCRPSSTTAPRAC